MAPATAVQMTENFKKQYPEQLARLPALRFIEQYDPEDEYTKDQPYAYVCDQVTEIRLGVDIDDVRGVGVQSEAWAALVELRDKVAPGEKVGWFIVVNGDLERWAPPLSDDEDAEDTETGLSVDENGHAVEEPPISPASQRSSVGKSSEDDAGIKRKGFKKWIGKIRKAKRYACPCRNDKLYVNRPQHQGSQSNRSTTHSSISSTSSATNTTTFRKSKGSYE